MREWLAPEERFRLILAAGARGDEAERDRLRHSGERITLRMEDHAPWAHAFDELAMIEFRPGPAFRPEGMLSWLRRTRPEGKPEPSMTDLVCPQRFAEDLDEVFRQRVEWWGG
jgi:hypothetical protein